MSAPRITQFLPLRQLSSPFTPRTHRRALHMTIPRDCTPILTTRRRTTTGQRSTADMSNANNTATDMTPTPPGRTFNTSRALKANKYSSTVDFAFLPTELLSFSSSATSGSSDGGEDMHLSRLPVVRARVAADSTASGIGHDRVQPVMRAVISSVNLDSRVSPMSDVSDNAAVEMDFGQVWDRVGSIMVVEEGEADAGTMEAGEVKRVWRGLVEDVLGEKRTGKLA